MFSIYGTNMGPASSPPLSSWPLQKTLGGVTIQIQDASGATLQAIPLYVSPGQINAILPSATAVGTATATATYGGQTSAPASFTVVKSSFGILAQDQAGSGPGVVSNYVQNAAWPMNTIVSSAQPGQPVVLWGTGLGPVTGDETTPPVQGDLRSGLDPMTLWVGGQQVNIDYAGRSTSAGQDQINFVAPNITGCWVPVTLQIGSMASNTITISISPFGGACQDPSMTNLNLATVQANGLKEGTVTLEQVTTHLLASGGGFGGGSYLDSTEQTALAHFVMYDGPHLMTLRGQGISTYGACTEIGFLQASAPDVNPDAGLDAGGALTVAGPDGASNSMLPPIASSVGDYAGILNPLTAGTYNIGNGTGGKDVGPFTASLTLPAPIAWTNMNAVTQIDRLAGLTVNWTGGSGDVIISGTAQELGPSGPVATFTCLARAEDGTFTVPSYVLMALPAAATGVGMAATLTVANQAATTNFTANGLDVGTFSALFVTQESVNFF
jgi:uncharacterized protein (TIGR03437 family)